jgi:hypothetical protein
MLKPIFAIPLDFGQKKIKILLKKKHASKNKKKLHQSEPQRFKPFFELKNTKKTPKKHQKTPIFSKKNRKIGLKP